MIKLTIWVAWEGAFGLKHSPPKVPPTVQTFSECKTIRLLRLPLLDFLSARWSVQSSYPFRRTRCKEGIAAFLICGSPPPSTQACRLQSRVQHLKHMSPREGFRKRGAQNRPQYIITRILLAPKRAQFLETPTSRVKKTLR